MSFKEDLVSALTTLAKTFEYQTPSDNVNYPCIVYYGILNEPLYFSDNKSSKSRRFLVNIEVYDENDVEDGLGVQVLDLCEGTLKGVLRSETDISDSTIFGVRYEIEFTIIK